MIELNSKNWSGKETIVNFGTGTVLISKAGDKSEALLLLKSQEPKEVGSYTEHNLEFQPCKIFAPEVVLSFKNIESLNVVIEELELLRDACFKNKE